MMDDAARFVKWNAMSSGRTLTLPLSEVDVVRSSSRSILKTSDRDLLVSADVDEKDGCRPYMKLKEVEVLHLPDQFARICATVEISEKELEDIGELIQEIADIVNKNRPPARIKVVATLFRHYYLGLRNAGSNQLLVYLSGSHYTPLFLGPKDLETTFKGILRLKALVPGSPQDVEVGFPFLDLKTKLTVGIVTHSDQQAEVVTCQLAKYLLEFDPRAKSLVTLVHFWAVKNSVTLCDKTTSIPDPAALEWLCLFFLGQEKVIPTLRVLEDHEKGRKCVSTMERRPGPEYNLAFPQDLKFLKEWKAANAKSYAAEGSSQYVLDVLKLAHDFLSFCSRNNLTDKVLNTVNAEKVPVLAAIEEGLIETYPDISKSYHKKSFHHQLMRKKALELEAQLKEELCLMKPLQNQLFDICQTNFNTHVRPLMTETARKLTFYLEDVQNTKNSTIYEVELKTLFECGRAEVSYGLLGNNVSMSTVEKPIPSPTTTLVNEVGSDSDDEGTRNASSLENPRIPSETVDNASISKLFAEFAELCVEVQVPEEQFKTFTALMKRIQKIVSQRNPKLKYTTMFRHNYLNLLNAGSNDLLIYISGLQYEPLQLQSPVTEIKKYFERSQLEYLPPSIGRVESGVPCTDLESGLNFGIVTDKDYQTEVVSCQLAKYLLDFDPRAKSLLTLVHYWARENGITLTNTKNVSKNSRVTSSVVPDPAALEWLCLFFLGQKKLIPTLNLLQNKAAGITNVLFEGDKKHNVAFPKDTKFVGEWRDEKMKNVAAQGSNQYVLYMLKLAQEFFSYFGKNNLKGFVLNTANAELVPLLSAIEEGLLDPSLTTKNECGIDQAFQQMRIKARTVDAKLKLQHEIYLMQPFLKRRFDICHEKFDTRVRPLMEKTARKLEAFIETLKKNKSGGVVDVQVPLKSMFKLTMEDSVGTPPGRNVGIDSESCYQPYFAYTHIFERIPKDIPVAVEEQQGPEPSPDVEDNPQAQSSIMEGLVFLINTVTTEICVPSSEWQELFVLKQKLENLFGLHGFSDCELVLFRNRYLKLRPMDSETRNIFFVDHHGLYSLTNESRQVLKPEVQQRFVDRIMDGHDYSEETKLHIHSTIPQMPAVVIESQDLPLLSFESWQFHIATTSFLPEVQACRLVEYYSTFDPRVKPLLKIVCYWAQLNNIQLGGDDPQKFIAGVAPDPALLDWLVMFFLIQHNILPPPCEISERIVENIIFDGVNIGFKADLKYAQERWNRYQEADDEQHVMNIFVLAREFFNFWNEFSFKAMIKPVIVNLKNGKYIEKQLVVENSTNIKDLSSAIGISVQDLMLINSDPKINESFYSSSEVVFLHPFYIKYRFSFRWETFLLSVCHKMGVTSKRLWKMLRAYNTNGDLSNYIISDPSSIFKAN